MATTLLVCKNNATSTAAGAINNSSDPVTFSVASGEGALFPSAFPFHITIDNEILSCTARTTDSLTCSRAQQSTTIASHSSGATVELRVTAKSITDLNTAVNAIETAATFDSANQRIGIANTAPVASLTLGTGAVTAATDGIQLGVTTPVLMYRSAARQLTVDRIVAIGAAAVGDPKSATGTLNSIYIEGAGTNAQISCAKSSGSAFKTYTAVGATEVERFRVLANGAVSWGPGGTTAIDNTLQRLSATAMQFTQGLTIQGALETITTLAVGTTMTVAGVASFNGSSIAVAGSLNFAATDGSSYLFTGTQSANPTVGAASQCKEYIKAAKKVFQYNDAGTTRYTTIDLTNGTVANSTTAP